jgi:predicted alpha/beta superfamily hydrolase
LTLRARPQVNLALCRVGEEDKVCRGAYAQAKIQSMIRPTALITLSTFLVCAAASLAQTPAPPVTLSDTEQRTIKSSKTGRSYDLFISLPEHYYTSKQSYPVLYVLDGWHFPLMASIQKNNIYSERMPPVIVINIGQSPAKDAMTLRARDFSPTAIANTPGSGGGPAFLDFLEHELVPFIDHTYRTNPSDRGLLGHSRGGEFALYALEQRPGLFQRIVAVSPAMPQDSVIFTGARRALSSLPASIRLDLSVGSEDELGFAESTTAFARLLDELKPKGLDYRFTLYPGENHNSVRLVAFPAGLYWVYRPAK